MKKKKKNRMPAVLVIAALASGLLFTVCEQNVEDSAPGKYAITFVANGGTLADGAVKKTVEDTAPRAIGEDFPANPTKEGYSFVEWRTSAFGAEGDAVISDTNLAPASDNVMAFARWNPLLPCYRW
jgi:uncharacterized repeat protein (TIGR02543 family)